MTTNPVPSSGERLDALFAPWSRSDAPGLAVGVAHRGATIYRRGFGLASVESGVANSAATRMRIGSTTKHFTALLALLLAEEGKLDLDVPVRQLLPEMQGPGGDPSIRLLLQHRGGSRCYLDLGFIGHGMAMPRPGRALAMQRRQQGRNFMPGEAVIYNNGGYQLVGAAIERVGGATLAAQLKTRLFDPVGMPDTLLLPSDHTLVPGMATLHVEHAAGGWRRGLFPSEELLAEGGIVSTVNDMLRWAAHLQRRDCFGTAATWQALTETPTLPDGTTSCYALGMMVGHYRGVPVVHHAGGVIGGSAQMLLVPGLGLEVVILCNGGAAADPIALAERVADIVLDGQLGPAAEPARAEAFAGWLGSWWSPESGMLYDLREDQGLLKASLCGVPMPPTLQPLASGELRLATVHIGDIGFLTGGRPGGDQLAIRFGGRTVLHRRVSAEGVDVAAFARASLGEYRSEDADSRARIALENGRPVLTLSDPCGTASHVLEPLGEAVALCQADVGGRPFGMVLSFDHEGFRLSTGRTRHLAFARV